ncbi:hypothetical protein D3C85_1730590 [compost metagenome]
MRREAVAIAGIEAHDLTIGVGTVQPVEVIAAELVGAGKTAGEECDVIGVGRLIAADRQKFHYR